MVLEIRLSNFFSIGEEISIDFRAASLQSANARALQHNTFKQGKTELLKTVLMYGANASGKSNIIKAIQFCHMMVLQSHNHNEGSIFSFTPFKFDGFPKKPSTYFIRFLIHGIEYEYTFALTQHEVVQESLFYYPKGRIKEVFTRDERKGSTKNEVYTFGDVIKRPMDVAESTSRKTLFISRASQMDRDIAKEVYRYFNDQFILHHFNFGILALNSLKNADKPLLIKALNLADSDIVDVKVKVLEQPAKTIHADFNAMTMSMEDTVQEQLQITTFHRRDPKRPFDLFTEESSGTIKLFFMMLTLLDIIRNNKVLLIDEIEESLHPDIIEYLFNLFRASKGAQLLCTTHNTSFLNLKHFRKDQIYFVNKKQDASTDLYSLYDYSDFRDSMNLEKAYRQGRFDAVPIVNDSLDGLQAMMYEQTK